METNNAYKKKDAQIQLENILIWLKSKGLKASELKILPDYAVVCREFDESLAMVIMMLLKERVTHGMVNSLANAYFSQFYKKPVRENDYDEDYDYVGEYDTFYEIMSETYLGLYSVISKSVGRNDNFGRIRIDTFLDSGPEFFVRKIRKYIQNNIIRDLQEKHSRELAHFDYDFIINDDEDQSSDNINSLKKNRYCIEASVEPFDALIRKLSYAPDTCFTLINSIIVRFMAKKPVAGYIFLCIINGNYEVREVVSDLKTKNFNWLFHKILKITEDNFLVDLSGYSNHVFEAEKYLESLSKTDDKEARNRIDRLASQTRKDVFMLQPVKAAMSDYIDVRGKYYTL